MCNFACESGRFRQYLCVDVSEHVLSFGFKGGVKGGVRMARSVKKLSDTAIRSAKMKAGKHSDGEGLYLVVTPDGRKSWAFLWKPTGAKWNREMGLGRYPEVPLARARELAAECRTVVAAGRDPVQERKKEEEPTFGVCSDALIESMSSSWRNAKHRDQWKMTLGDTYCKDLRGKKVSEVSTSDVLAVLKPIWNEKPETASRLRGRIERVLDFAKAKGWRTGDNPALWRGHLRNLLPKPKQLSRGHHSAMPYEDVPAFMVKLRAIDAVAARALELLVLTASRSGEVREMEWEEVDLGAGVWTVPATRMKAGREHRVPLAPPALALLRNLHELQTASYVFPGQGKGRKSNRGHPISVMAMTMLLRRMDLGHFTPHGFRSSFRDWAGDRSSFPRELAEAALAHTVGDETERAYRRSDALERRRKLMAAWASFCDKRASG